MAVFNVHLITRVDAIRYCLAGVRLPEWHSFESVRSLGPGAALAVRQVTAPGPNRCGKGEVVLRRNRSGGDHGRAAASREHEIPAIVTEMACEEQKSNVKLH